MQIPTRPDPATAPLKLLALLALIVADSKASPIPQSIGARTMGITSPDEGLMTVKNILEWLFAAAALIVVGSVFVWRAQFLRANNRPLRDFFSFIEAPQRRGLSPPSIRPNFQPRESGLTPIPLQQQRRGRTHATDVDSEGRRLGGPDPDDFNGDVTEKDVLPAYEIKGGPPNYNQFLAVDPGADTNGRSQITETALIETFPRPQLVEAGSRTIYSPNQPTPGLNIQLPRPPPPSYSPVSATSRHIMPPTDP